MSRSKTCANFFFGGGESWIIINSSSESRLTTSGVGFCGVGFFLSGFGSCLFVFDGGSGNTTAKQVKIKKPGIKKYLS